VDTLAGHVRDTALRARVTTGGSPVSSVVGLAVLDVIRDEGLQANAARVGSHLKGRLEELAVRHR